MIVDPAGKSRHCALMLVAACVLADCAPEDVQQRGIARYSYLWADAFLEWIRRWRNQLAREAATKRGAAEAKRPIDQLAQILESAGGVRDYLAAKRQPVGAMRADDIEGTALLWEAVNPGLVSALGQTAVHAYDTLNQATGNTGSIIDVVGLPDATRHAIAAALPVRNPSCWYLAADTAANQRAFTLPVAQGGALGQIIAQINDVAGHLDVLLRIAPLVEQALAYDWLVRSSMVLELSALLDLTLGPAPGGKYNVMFPLLELCRRGRPKEAATTLERLRDSIGAAEWTKIRRLRNKIAAHLDDELTMTAVHRDLLEMDYARIARLAGVLLDRLDHLGATELDLPLLLLGEQPIQTWSTDPAKVPPGAPNQEAMKGAMVRLFRTLDSPYMAVTPSSMGSPILTRITQARRPRPRTPQA